MIHLILTMSRPLLAPSTSIRFIPSIIILLKSSKLSFRLLRRLRRQYMLVLVNISRALMICLLLSQILSSHRMNLIAEAFLRIASEHDALVQACRPHFKR